MSGQLVAKSGFVVAAPARPPGLAGIALHFDITFIVNTAAGAIRIGVGRGSVRRYQVGLLDIVLGGAVLVL
jgi:hypothetical protein